ncbi:hypothetical protein nbrc107696_29340 [Gordonia spumicola]|uniref:Mycothiol-dependent maleylpyruvate isomerase metal-binding domain-containing protein n=1 Tax=Gordonia spumicola TaxID=589161 RepID=A0A7I9VAT1_9ACTN|nr:maleylpyruvate isomerase N-terminal domain-containing protein [Gordonia spumicola]GEE02488.1 hypothetical protein nbrc107696_29340 [Gordonia spumicola]
MSLHDPASVREWYADAAAAFVDAVDRVPASTLDRPALGEWSMRSLVGHTCRSAFTTIEMYAAAARARIDSGGELGVTHESPASYFHAALDSVTDPAAVTAAGVRAGIDLGDDPLDHAHDLAARGVALVDALPDDAVLLTPVGAIAAPDYLATRAFELSVHTLDVVDAAELEAPALLPGCARRAAAFAASLTRDDDVYTLVRGILGRGALPDGFTCLR